MGKLYTLDQKLLTNTPEIRIGEKIYPIDDRTKTVMKATKLDTANVENVSKILELALRCLSAIAGDHHRGHDRGRTRGSCCPISGSQRNGKMMKKRGMISNLTMS